MSKINSRQKGCRGQRRKMQPFIPIEGEEWKPVVGYEGRYEVSNLGRVKGLPKKTRKEGMISLYCHPSNGYVYVNLSDESGNKKNHRVHKLVMEAFTDYRSGGELVIDHIDCDKTNNRLENLEAVTPKVNAQRAIANGLVHYVGEMVVDLDEMKIYETYTDAAKAVGGNQGEMVARVCRGERSHYRNHHFATLKDFYNGTIPTYTGKTIKKASETLWR